MFRFAQHDKTLGFNLQPPCNEIGAS